ncbi:MAG: type II toxin-antitoxin system prevent-host-death family antitoxin [Chloroflexi bacterium]|nr:type II toxin-antitoxin system prevent-host-death family antitoxin [Chloroflexota bacterium]
MTSITMKEAKKDFESLAIQVESNAEPLIITLESGSQLVLMPLEDFSAWQETAYLLSNPANAAHLRQSINQARAGKTTERELMEI